MSLLIIIPAYNEAGNIERVVSNLQVNFPQYDYIVVNDGSKDETAQICRKNGFNLLDLPVNTGLAGAFQAGVKYAYRNGYDRVLQFDGDGQHDAKYIKEMLDTMEKEEADIVIGTRFKDKIKPKGLRMFGNTFIERAIKLTTGKRVSDPTSGMRMLNREMMKLFANNINFGPEPDTISYLIRCGAKVAEVQVEMQDRIEGESYLNLKRAMIYMINMSMSIIFIQWFRKKEGIR